MKISFSHIPWNSPAPGVRFKKFVSGDTQVRLVEFSEGFIEPEYCRKGHLGYVVEGCMDLDVNGTMTEYRTGDAFILSENDEASQHKVVMGKGGRVVLALFEHA